MPTHLGVCMANNLRLLRKKAGLTQAQLAQRIGSVNSSVSYWEIGTRTPTPTKILALAAALKCEPDALGFNVTIPDELIATFQAHQQEPPPRAPAGVVPLLVLMGKDGLTITAPEEYALDIQYRPVDSVKCNP